MNNLVTFINITWTALKPLVLKNFPFLKQLNFAVDTVETHLQTLQKTAVTYNMRMQCQRVYIIYYIIINQ